MGDDSLIDKKRLDDLAVAPGKPGKAHEEAVTGPDHRRDADFSQRNLEAGIEDSMDASDPPSSTQP